MTTGQRCRARIRPFPDDTELLCEVPMGHDGGHHYVLRDRAGPGSATVITWYDDDRRTFYGDWLSCPDPGCVLPLYHHGDHAT